MPKPLPLLLAVLLLLLPGCRSQQQSDDDLTVTPTYVTGRGDQVEGLFTAHLPADWADRVVWENEETDTTYALVFYQRASREAGMGGHLFTLMSLPDETDFDQFPQYSLLGYMEPEGGAREQLLVIYPSDVQFDEPQRVEYRELLDAIPGVLERITFASGCTFRPASQT